jgi:hypothetical protein
LQNLASFALQDLRSLLVPESVARFGAARALLLTSPFQEEVAASVASAGEVALNLTEHSGFDSIMKVSKKSLSNPLLGQGEGISGQGEE